MKIVAASISVLIIFLNSSTSWGRQIRLDENTCTNIAPEYQRKLGNPLYAKALAAQREGKANDRQKERIREVQFLRGALISAKCKGVK